MLCQSRGMARLMCCECTDRRTRMADGERVHVSKKQIILSELRTDKIPGVLQQFRSTALHTWRLSCVSEGGTPFSDPPLADEGLREGYCMAKVQLPIST